MCGLLTQFPEGAYERMKRYFRLEFRPSLRRFNRSQGEQWSVLGTLSPRLGVQIGYSYVRDVFFAS